MSREDPQLRIRLPVDLKEKIQDSANAHKRSINSQIVAVLAEYYEQAELNRDTVSVTISNEKLASNEKIRKAFWDIFDELGKKVIEE